MQSTYFFMANLQSQNVEETRKIRPLTDTGKKQKQTHSALLKATLFAWNHTNITICGFLCQSIQLEFYLLDLKKDTVYMKFQF